MRSELAIFGGSPTFSAQPTDLCETISQRTLHYVEGRLRDGKISIVDGDDLERFESLGAALFGGKYGAAMSTGTAAIHAGLTALHVGAGDEVIVPTYAYHGTAIPVCVTGAKPIFVDVDPDTMTLDPQAVARAITSRTKAIIVLLPFGNMPFVDALAKLSKSHNIPLLADASHAHGALWADRGLCEFFDVVAVSFGKGKLISGGELGLVASNRISVRDTCLAYHHTNRVPKAIPHSSLSKFHNALSIKYRPHGLAVSLAASRIEEYPEVFGQLSKCGDRFMQQLTKIPGLEPIKTPSVARRSYWNPCIKYDPVCVAGLTAEQFTRVLRADGVPAEVSHYSTLLHEMNIFKDYYGVKTQEDLQQSTIHTNRLVHIPHRFFFDEQSVEKLLCLLRRVVAHFENREENFEKEMRVSA